MNRVGSISGNRQLWPALLLTLALVAIGGLLIVGPVTARTATRRAAMPSSILLGAAAGVLPPITAAPVLRPVPTTPLPGRTERDLSRYNVHPRPLGAPDNGVVGTLGSYTSIAPDVVTPTGRVAILTSGLAVGEVISYTLGGTQVFTVTADANGVGYLPILTAPGEGSVTVVALGMTGGRTSGGVWQQVSSGPHLPGLAIVPHAVRPNGTDPITVAGVGYDGHATAALARDTTLLFNTSVGGDGRFSVSFAVPFSGTNGAGSALYNSYIPALAGSLAAQSIEERTDAGPPSLAPAADQNLARGFADRPILRNTGVCCLTAVGEGFLPGEVVTYTNLEFGLSSTQIADANGAAHATLNATGLPGSFALHARLDGQTSGRVAYGAGLTSNLTADVPAMIVAPSRISDTVGTVAVLMTRFAPSQVLTIALDGALVLTTTTTNSGIASVTIPKPAGGFLHTVTATSTSGQAVSAPLVVVPPALPTATVTATASAGSATATPASGTATATAPAATATAGALTATPTTAGTPLPNTTATPCPVRFSDVTDTTAYYYASVYYLACRGVISGYSDGTFKPFNNTTRGQMTKIVTLAFNITSSTPPATGTFEDVDSSSVFYGLIETAVAHGIVSGYSCGGINSQTGVAEPCDSTRRPYFRPNNAVTRGQLAKIVVIGAGWTLHIPPTPTFIDVAAGNVFYPFIETAVCHGAVGGYSDSTFRPNNYAFRGQIAKIVHLAVTNTAACSGSAAAGR